MEEEIKLEINNMSSGQEDMFYIKIKTSNGDINILVDGGRSGNRCIEKIKESGVQKLDYIVLTHIDSDHIAGLLTLLNNSEMNEICKDAVIVYNKFINGLISYKQAEKFEKLIGNHEVVVSYKEYQENSGEIVFLSLNQRLMLKPVDEKVYFTFIAPDKEKVEKLYNNYDYFIKNRRNASRDSEIVNHSSIIFVMEHNQKAILMTGDGYLQDIIPSIKKLAEEARSPIKEYKLIKLPHHGSEKNNDGIDELLVYAKCDTFLITFKEKGSVKISKKMVDMLKNKTVYTSEVCEIDGAINHSNRIEV